MNQLTFLQIYLGLLLAFLGTIVIYASLWQEKRKKIDHIHRSLSQRNREIMIVMGREQFKKLLSRNLHVPVAIS